MFVHQLDQFALGQDRVLQIEPTEFNLGGLILDQARGEQFLEGPIVKRSVIFEFQCAEGMRNALYRILDRVGEVVHGVNAPCVAGGWMGFVFDSEQCWISHVNVGRCHVYFCP